MSPRPLRLRRINNPPRPTITRIYAKARQKIAEDMVLGKQVIIEGGKNL